MSRRPARHDMSRAFRSGQPPRADRLRPVRMGDGTVDRYTGTGAGVGTWLPAVVQPWADHSDWIALSHQHDGWCWGASDACRRPPQPRYLWCHAPPLSWRCGVVHLWEPDGAGRTGRISSCQPASDHVALQRGGGRLSPTSLPPLDVFRWPRAGLTAARRRTCV